MRFGTWQMKSTTLTEWKPRIYSNAYISRSAELQSSRTRKLLKQSLAKTIAQKTKENWGKLFFFWHREDRRKTDVVCSDVDKKLGKRVWEILKQAKRPRQPRAACGWEICEWEVLGHAYQQEPLWEIMQSAHRILCSCSEGQRTVTDDQVVQTDGLSSSCTKGHLSSTCHWHPPMYRSWCVHLHDLIPCPILPTINQLLISQPSSQSINEMFRSKYQLESK
jgi:hypothetical protein